MAKMWFGNTVHQQWVPCPSTGLQKHRLRYSVELDYENSGRDVVSSKAWATVYEMDFPVRDARDYEGIEAFSRFSSGEYDYGSDGYVRFIDPMYADQNLFSPRFAAPGLIEQGWRNWGPVDPTFSDVGANSYGKPMRSATWELPGVPFGEVDLPQGSVFTFIIPPEHTLWVGATGSATDADIYFDSDSSVGDFTVTLLADSAAPSFSAHADGETSGTIARLGIKTTTVETPGTITINSMWAQIIPTGSTPSINRHLPGNGHEGLKFSGDDPNPDEYIYGPSRLVGMAGSRLVESEPWA